MSNSQVTRVSSGGVIQIRTGVIQGIGPQGPSGQTGPLGLTGAQGVQGVPGPSGAVLARGTYAVTGTQGVGLSTVTSNYPTTLTNLNWNAISYDDLSVMKSAVNLGFVPGNDYTLVVTARFFKQTSVNGSGFRLVNATYAGLVVGEMIVPASILVDTSVNLHVGFRASANASDVLNIKVSHSDTASLNVYGTLWVNQIGPGPAGAAGPQGIPGPIGPQGVQGTIGPAGSLINNSTLISDIGGTDPTGY